MRYGLMAQEKLEQMSRKLHHWEDRRAAIVHALSQVRPLKEYQGLLLPRAVS